MRCGLPLFCGCCCSEKHAKLLGETDSPCPALLSPPQEPRRLFDGAMFATLYRTAAADAEARCGARAAASTSVAAAEAERLVWGAGQVGAEEGLALPLPPWAAEELAAHQRGDFAGEGLLGALAAGALRPEAHTE